MAEAVVGVLIGKLGMALANEAATYGASLLCKEAKAVKGLFGEIRKAKEELENMHAYLRDSDKLKDTNETTGIFVNKIRELSFKIEDVVDEFTYKLEDNKHGGFAAKMKKWIKHAKVWRCLALQLCDINDELEAAVKRKTRYAIPPGSQNSVGSSDHHFGPTNQIWCLPREEDLVGVKDNADKLKGWLVDDLEERKTKITTVWGMGGVGKTTLVDHVYKIVKLDFEAAAWVTVSKSYLVEDLLKKIAEEFGIPIDSSNMDKRSIVQTIRNHLEGKRYILVLDDVWQQDVWINIIMPVFPTNCTSRFVLTSRMFDVASLATSNCTIELTPLRANHSWELFCKEAFRKSDEKCCPSELLSLAVKFLQKCDGLPIAIACIGRLLSFKHTTYHEWYNVFKELELQSTNSVTQGVDIILKISMEDLPYELKNCFLHCAIFPEDYELSRRRTIRHWITSGFIKEKENKTLEQVAEGYLRDLVNRSLLQVVKKNDSGRVKRCRMHDLIRHLAADKAAKEFFGKIYDGHGSFSAHETRRLSIQTTNIVPMNQSNKTHLRAIYNIMGSLDIWLLRPILESSMLLSILDLQGTKMKVLPSEVFSLFNLRFLGLRHTGIESLPEAIGRLQNLEVLDAYRTCLLSLPKNVAKLRKLRYLYATVTVTEGCFQRQGGVKVPGGIRNLTGLHVLQSVKASSETLSDVPALVELRKFGVDGVTSEQSLSLRRALLNMSNLISLEITSEKNEVLPLEEVSLPESLSKLELLGQLEKERMPHILSSWMHLNNLTFLCLAFSKLDENSFHSLMVLQNLCSLGLYEAYDGKTLRFSGRSFPRLRTLRVVGALLLSQVEIGEDALESLAVLQFSTCPELKRLPHGIEYLTALDELCMEDTADEFIDMLRQEHESNECKEELMKISHIREAIVSSTEKNFWRKFVSRKGDVFAG